RAFNFWGFLGFSAISVRNALGARWYQQMMGGQRRDISAMPAGFGPPAVGPLRLAHPTCRRPASRLLQSRAKGVGVSLGHRLQERPDGLAANDLVITHEHPVRDIGLSKLGKVALVLAWQILRLIVEPSGVAAVRQPLHVVHPDMLAVIM